MREAICADGFTIRSPPTGASRGLGLALVRQITQLRGGMISVGRDAGAVFTAVLPGCVRPSDQPESAGEETEQGRMAAQEPVPTGTRADPASQPEQAATSLVTS